MGEDKEKLIVIKRNGKKTTFDGTKIILAIKKAFDSVETREIKQKTKYTTKDVQKVYQKVIEEISKIEEDRIKIEEIQDIIEKQLKQNGYEDIYNFFSTYRKISTQLRQTLGEETDTKKYLKYLQALALNSEYEANEIKTNSNIDKSTSTQKIINFGKKISEKYAESYLIKKDYVLSHENGDIYIHDLEHIPMGTTSCSQIELDKLFERGIQTTYGNIKEPQCIQTYANLVTTIIGLNQNDQHGMQSIPYFDYYMAPGVLKTFKTELQQAINELLEYTDFDKFIATNGIEREINKISTIEIDVSIFYKYTRESEELKRLFRMAYQTAMKKTNKQTYDAIENLVYNSNLICSKIEGKPPLFSISFGTDISPEGRLITKTFLEIINKGIGKGKTPKYPISIFKIKEGINYNNEDINYDLFELACQVSAKRGLPNFSFVDASFNKKYYKKENYNTEVTYLGDGTRIFENIASSDKQVTAGRGNLSVTTINLPKIGIKHGIIQNGKINKDLKPDMQGFYKELDKKLNIAKNQLLERFEIQCSKHTYNFPFFMKNGIWLDGEKLGENDKIRRVLKHGTMSIGFIGLAECLKSLIGENHAESKKAQELGIEIIEHMRKKTDEFTKKYNLNFNIMANPEEELLEELTKTDRTIYGDIQGVTDKNHYTNSFHVPEYMNATQEKIIEIEAPYHKLTNGGHISHIEIDKDTIQNIDEFKENIKLMKDTNMGYVVVKKKC